jgi:predicted  nucleic acid-binding Zn-ribbon protein
LSSQAAAQSSYQALTDQKEKSAQQHQVELTALSSNLSGLRQQVESYKKRINIAEATVKEQTAQLTGGREKDGRGRSESEREKRRGRERGRIWEIGEGGREKVRERKYGEHDC